MSKPITRRPARRIEDGPGFYMRSRRQAAGKTIAQCGEAIAALGHGPMAAHDIAALDLVPVRPALQAAWVLERAS